ncbi:metalloendopeptidase [Oleoguttula sp. CCFEE 5521]
MQSFLRAFRTTSAYSAASPRLYSNGNTYKAFTSPLGRPQSASRTTLSGSRSFHQSSYTARQAFNYQRFNASRNIFQRWAARPTFYYEVGGIGAVGGGVYIANLEEVPVSHRRRFNVVSPATEAETGKQMYQQTMQEFGNRLLPPSHPKSRMVQRVLNRLIPHSGLDGEEWEVHVIEDPMKNAFVIPGGKVFVFSGILDVCKGDDGLAAVLGHEIAHNVAHHAAERMSSSFILMGIALIGSAIIGLDFGFGRMIIDFAFLRPGSRAQEQAADYIGLLMMAESCYDPAAAMGLWARMEEEEKNAPPQFLSTHPSNHARLEKIRQWLPEAEVKRESGDCAATGSYASDFRRTTQMPQYEFR